MHLERWCAERRRRAPGRPRSLGGSCRTAMYRNNPADGWTQGPRRCLPIAARVEPSLSIDILPAGCGRGVPQRPRSAGFARQTLAFKPSRNMPYLIGTDEAGYCAQSGAAGHLRLGVLGRRSDAGGTDLYHQLKRHRLQNRAAPRRRSASVAIADSKALYSPALGLAHARTRRAGGSGAGRSLPRRLARRLAACSTRASLDDLPTMPWHVDYDLRLPLAADADDLVRLVPAAAARLRDGRRAAGGRWPAGPCFPMSSIVRTTRTATRAKRSRRPRSPSWPTCSSACAGEPVLVVCDKHGGRNSTAGCCSSSFPIR